MRPPPRSRLFPYTTLFRSHPEPVTAEVDQPAEVVVDGPCPEALGGVDHEHDGRGEPEQPRGQLVDVGGVREQRPGRSEEHTSELQSLRHLVCRLLLEKKKT